MGFLITLWEKKWGQKSSSSVAKDRLMEVLIHDRVKLPPETMEKIRQEIIAVLSKYIEVDREGMEVTLTRAEGSQHLTANVPIRRTESFNVQEPDEPDEPAPSATRPSPPAASRRPPPSSKQLGPQPKKRH